ncbi:hypothetical protein RRG08_028581 [Elysia crispata]|uniref:Uncharacterized protein n=1 Tax=Elysia crispata TaxID=231223 RepID=A0AAE0YBA2_9GAST|nr:hypothetical protein RRG08_028581 [Elysia crispata]
MRQQREVTLADNEDGARVRRQMVGCLHRPDRGKILLLVSDLPIAHARILQRLDKRERKKMEEAENCASFRTSKSPSPGFYGFNIMPKGACTVNKFSYLSTKKRYFLAELILTSSGSLRQNKIIVRGVKISPPSFRKSLRLSSSAIFADCRGSLGQLEEKNEKENQQVKGQAKIFEALNQTAASFITVERERKISGILKSF